MKRIYKLKLVALLTIIFVALNSLNVVRQCFRAAQLSTSITSYEYEINNEQKLIGQIQDHVVAIDDFIITLLRETGVTENGKSQLQQKIQQLSYDIDEIQSCFEDLESAQTVILTINLIKQNAELILSNMEQGNTTSDQMWFSQLNDVADFFDAYSLFTEQHVDKILFKMNKMNELLSIVRLQLIVSSILLIGAIGISIWIMRSARNRWYLN